MNDRLSSSPFAISLLDGLVGPGLHADESWYWGREPLTKAGLARGIAERFDWSCLEAMLASAEADVVLVYDGPATNWQAPRDLKQLRHCFGSKIGLTVRGTERFCPVSRAVADDLSQELGPARIHLCATPAQAGVGFRYEDDHVFIVQTVGVKDYYFRPNTVSSDVPAGDQGYAAYDKESSRLWSARLRPGDVLYLPARWWHRSRSEQVALSLSIAVSTPALPAYGAA